MYICLFFTILFSVLVSLFVLEPFPLILFSGYFVDN